MRMFLHCSTLGLLFFLYIPLLPSVIHKLNMDNCFAVGSSQESISCSGLSLGPHFLISLTRKIILCPRYFPLDFKSHGANQNLNSFSSHGANQNLNSSSYKTAALFLHSSYYKWHNLGIILSNQFPSLINSTFMTSISFMPFYSLKLPWSSWDLQLSPA